MRILLTGGGSGGHVVPLMTVAEELRSTNEDVDLFYLGPLDIVARDILSQHNIKIYHNISSKIRRYFSVANIIDLFKLPFGFIDAVIKVYRIRPDVVFSKGGYGSFWPVIVAYILCIPVLLHESDSVPGVTNRILSRFANKVAISFKESAVYFPIGKSFLTGNPIRKELLDVSESYFADGALTKQILIVGGSQGSERINMLILGIINPLLEKYIIMHQCGVNNYAEMTILSEQAVFVKNKNRYQLRAFLDINQLKDAYATSHLVITRAGAGAIFEIAATARPSILIPLSSAAQNHQSINANVYAKSGACLVLPEDGLDGSKLLEIIDHILGNTNIAGEMSRSAKSFFAEYKNAASAIAKEVLLLHKT